MRLIREERGEKLKEGEGEGERALVLVMSDRGDVVRLLEEVVEMDGGEGEGSEGFEMVGLETLARETEGANDELEQEEVHGEDEHGEGQADKEQLKDGFLGPEIFSSVRCFPLSLLCSPSDEF